MNKSIAYLAASMRSSIAEMIFFSENTLPCMCNELKWRHTRTYAARRHWSSKDTLGDHVQIDGPTGSASGSAIHPAIISI